MHCFLRHENVSKAFRFTLNGNLRIINHKCQNVDEELVILLDFCLSEITCCRALKMEQSGCGVFKPLLV